MPNDEVTYFSHHPYPENSNPEPMTLSLYNYPIGRTTLVPAHRAALMKFIGPIAKLGPHLSSTTFSILGHASGTGEAQANQALSEARAATVRDAILEIGFVKKAVVANGAGSASPADPAPSGQAYARNRRVDITMQQLSWDAIGPVPDIVTGIASAPTARPPAAAPPQQTTTFVAPVFTGMEFSYTWKLPPITTPSAFIEESVEIAGRVKVLSATNTDQITLNLKVQNDKFDLGAKFETKLYDELALKVTVAPWQGGKLPSAGIGIKDTFANVGLEWGLQIPSNPAKPAFLHYSFSIPKVPLVTFDIDGAKVAVDITLIKVKFVVGPTPATVRATARFAVATGTKLAAGASAVAPIILPLAAGGGVLMLATLIIGGSLLLLVDAQQEGLEFAHRLATRDGAASRVAYETLGIGSLTALTDRKAEWLKIAGTDGQTAFLVGVTAVQDLLKTLDAKPAGGDRAAKHAAWLAAYATDANANSFNVVRERIFLRLGGYDRDQSAVGMISSL